MDSSMSSFSFKRVPPLNQVRVETYRRVRERESIQDKRTKLCVCDKTFVFAVPLQSLSRWAMFGSSIGHVKLSQAVAEKNIVKMCFKRIIWNAEFFMRGKSYLIS